MNLPEDNQRGSSGNCWMRATQQTQYITICSQVGWFMGHWAPRLRGSARCLGDACSMCAAGAKPRPFYYVAVLTENGPVKFFEIPRRHREIAEQLVASSTKGVGVQVMIKKDGGLVNSPILMAITGFEPCEEFDIWPFVGTLGLTIPAISPREDSAERVTQSESFVPLSAEDPAM